MSSKLKLIDNNSQGKKESISLHPAVTNILFEQRRYIKNLFLQIKGHYDIAYFGINIINPSNEVISFSSLPHIEYNLIQQDLWQHDPHFAARNLSKNTLLWWDDIDDNNLFKEQIQQIKLSSNNFSAGMTLSREIDGFIFLYSYATTTEQINIKEYYNSHTFTLIDIGDYFCKAILNIYAEYCGNHALPHLNQLHSKATTFNMRSTLKLIVSNLI